MKTKTPTPKLRFRRLHTLLAAGLKDLRRVKRSPKHKIDMYLWCQKNNGGCSVCLAGAVMLFRLDAVKIMRRLGQYELFGYDFDSQTDAQLNALDALRRGFLGNAVSFFYGNLLLPDEIQKKVTRCQRELEKHIRITPFADEPDPTNLPEFWERLRLLQQTLKKHDL